eukprot:7763568-Karenia_brevis.AAC.1
MRSKLFQRDQNALGNFEIKTGGPRNGLKDLSQNGKISKTADNNSNVISTATSHTFHRSLDAQVDEPETAVNGQSKWQGCCWIALNGSSSNHENC